MPQASLPDPAANPAGSAPLPSGRSPQGSQSDKPAYSPRVRQLTTFHDFHHRRPSREHPRQVISLEGVDTFDLDTLEGANARVSADKSRGAAVRRNAVFKEGRVAEELGGYWVSLSRAGRFITRTIHRGRYREAITREEIFELEDAVAAHLARALEALRARERELADVLADFGIGAADVVSARPKRVTMLIDNPMQTMGLDLALAVDSVVALLWVLDSLYYRRGLTKSESSARTQADIRRAMNRLQGELLYVIKVAKKSHSYCERIADEQYGQLREDEERREKRRSAEEAARERQEQDSEERLRAVRAESDALWADIEKKRRAERRQKENAARKAAAAAIERSRRKAEAAFGPVGSRPDSASPAETGNAPS